MSRTPIRAVVFDLDGTLADTLDDIADAMNHALAAHGLPTRPRDDYRDLVGEGVERLVERAIPPDRRDLLQTVTESLRERYTEHMLDRTRVYPGVAALLDGLTARGVPMAILSNKPELATGWMVDRLFSAWTFAVIAGASPHTPLKPHPAGLLRIAERLGVAPPECIYLGDTRTDMQTAVAAGMVPVGALWGFRDRQELLDHGARRLVASPQELLHLLDGGSSPSLFPGGDPA